MQEKDLQIQTNTLVENATEIVIINAEDNVYANEVLKKMMVGEKVINGYWEEDIKGADRLHKGLVLKRNTMLKPLLVGKRKVKDLIEDYLTKEKEEREAQEREIRIETEKKEKIRLAEIAKREEELKKAADYLSPEQIAEEQRKIEEANKKEFTPTIIIDKPEKIKGQIIREIWSVEITDINLIPRKYLLADMKRLNALAVSEKGKLDIPGIKAVKEINVSTRA